LTRTLLVALAAVSLLAARGSAAGKTVTIVAAGDIACGSGIVESLEDADDRDPNGCKDMQTSTLAQAARPDAVLPLGDEQYPIGALSAFQHHYHASWGRFDQIAFPVPGNHEYGTHDALGYFGYFKSRAGDRERGYYSYDLGAWHMIAINANCGHTGGCGAGSPEEMWLKNDLAAAHKRCVLAYWHQPRFSSGLHGSNGAYDAFWRDLYASHADVVVNGHDHLYERFAQQSPDGVADAKGIREIIAGTGGKSHYAFRTPLATSQLRDNRDFGVLVMQLHDDSYDWEFRSVGGATVDRGSAKCNAK